MSMPLLKAKLKAQMRKEATSLPVALEAESKTRTRQLALQAVNGDLNELDFDNLEALGRIKGDLSNTFIESVSAAKITSATMLARTLTLAGTDASANKTSLVMIGDALIRVNDGTADQLKLSNAGMEIAASDEGITPTSQAGRGIFNLGTKNSGITYFSNPSRRGWSVRADGVGGGGVNGHLFLIASGNSAAIATDVGNWASLEAQISHSGAGVISGRAGIILRNMLWCVGPARVGGDLHVTGNITTDANLSQVGNVNVISGGQYNANALVATFGAGITANGTIKSNTGNLVGQGLNIESGGVALPTNTVSGGPIMSHATDDTLRAISANHQKTGSTDTRVLQGESVTEAILAPGIKNGGWSTYSARTIGSLLGGSVNNVSSGNHSHSAGNAQNIDRIPEEDRKRILAYRKQILDDLEAGNIERMTPAQLRVHIYNLTALLAATFSFTSDAPDIDADERQALRDAGEEVLPGWEYRASKKREEEGLPEEPAEGIDGTLFRGQKHYSGGQPPRSIRPPGLHPTPRNPMGVA